MNNRGPARRLVSLGLLLCFTGNLFLAPAVQAAGAGGGSAAASTSGKTVLAYKGAKISPALVAIASNKALLKRRAKALYALVLLRLAHLFVNNPDGPPSDADTAQAMAPLTEMSLADTALDIGGFMAASVFASATEQLLKKRFPPTTFPQKFLLKVKSYGPIFTAWAVANGIHDQVREGLWRDGFKWGLVQDLAVRVGQELLTTVAVVFGLKLIGYPFKLVAKVAADKLGQYATLRAITSTIGVWASRALTAANVAGWVLLAVMIFYPMAKTAYAAEQVRQLRRLVGQQVRYRERLTGVLLSRNGEKLAEMLGPMDSRILLNGYRSSGDPFAASKFELLIQLGHANNELVEEKLRQLKDLHVKNFMERAQKPGDTRKREARIEEIKNELRAVFGNGEAHFLDLDGLDTIGETAALEAELRRLEGVRRDVSNMAYLGPRQEMLIERTERILEKNLKRRKPAHLEASQAARNDPAIRQRRAAEFDRFAQDELDNVRTVIEEELLSLKDYIQERLDQIKRLSTHFPTEGEAVAEANIGQATFQAMQELSSPEGSEGTGGAPGFDGIEGQ